jgi:hypothetical protein
MKLEAETGKKVVSPLNAMSTLSLGNKKDKKKNTGNCD